MKILSLNFNHDSSIVLLNDGKIEFFQLSERITKIKHDHDTNRLLGLFHEKGLTRKYLYDKVICTNFQHWTTTQSPKDEYQQIIFPIADFVDFIDLEICLGKHHLYHTFCGFHNSGFDEAVVITSDGGGSCFDINGHKVQEHTTVIHIKYPNKILFHYKELFNLNVKINLSSIMHKNFDYNISNQRGYPQKFGIKSAEMGWGPLDAGKVMGLSQCIGHEDQVDQKWRNQIKSCNNLQVESQEYMLSLIKKYTEETGCKNVVITGGYALNCVANYFYLKNLKDINLYVDPIANDNGIALGAAYYTYYNSAFPRKNRKKLSSVFLGHEEPTYNLSKISEENTQKVSAKDVAELICDGNIIALFQGKSEVGQRSLGNRSILFDPRKVDGKDIVNVVKKRESFRPFGATILHEHCNEWFDMMGLDESPFMMYAVDAKEGVKEKIPAVIHYDNTCRIQTVTKLQNRYFYNLIKEFYSLTDVPILLNTSFNLAGEPLVETFEDALKVLEESKIDFLYLPELSLLIKNGEQNHEQSSKTRVNHSGSGRSPGQKRPGSDFLYC